MDLVDELYLSGNLTFNEWLKDFRKRERKEFMESQKNHPDFHLWKMVLKVIKKKIGKEHELYWTLKGFMIAGAKLTITNKELKMKPIIGGFWGNKYQWEKDRAEYLLPYKENIKSIFNEVLGKVNSD